MLAVTLFSLFSISFAAPEAVDTAQYAQQDAEILDIPNDTVPIGPADDDVIDLPKTGGIPPEAFYAAGALLIILALIISMKKRKAA